MPEGDLIAQPTILTPAPERVRPPCPHYRACGAARCNMRPRILSRAGRRAWSNRRWPRRLAAIPGGRNLAPAVAAAGHPVGAADQDRHDPGRYYRASDTVVEIADCLILHPRLTATFPRCAPSSPPALAQGRDVKLTVTLTDGGVDLAATGGKPIDAALFETLAHRGRGRPGAPVVERRGRGDPPPADRPLAPPA